MSDPTQTNRHGAAVDVIEDDADDEDATGSDTSNVNRTSTTPNTTTTVPNANTEMMNAMGDLEQTTTTSTSIVKDPPPLGYRLHNGRLPNGDLIDPKNTLQSFDHLVVQQQ